MMLDLLPVVEIGAISFLGYVVWHQHRAIEALQPDRLAIENAERVEVTKRHAA